MKNNKELLRILGEMLPLNKCRLDCLSNLILALIVARTTNLAILSVTINSGTLALSCMRRLQRFFAEVQLDFDRLAKGLLSLVFSNQEGLYLLIDRTNWKFGEKNINILTLAAAHSNGAAIPILWVLLDKKGNSNTAERKQLLERFFKIVGRERISGFLADREFIGIDWFHFLREEGVPFIIRIRMDAKTKAYKKKVTLEKLFADLGVQQFRQLRKPRLIWGLPLYLSALRLPSGELLILASDQKQKQALKLYGRRWEIETLFQCLKSRGFNFEDTRITKLDRLERMVAVLAIAFVWAVKVGEWCTENIKILNTKKHGRPEKSIFRYGLDALNQAVLGHHYQDSWTKFLLLLNPKQQFNRCRV